MIGRYRWMICGLLFLATLFNYTDRQVLGILAPRLEVELGWSESDYGLIVAAFSTAYAIGLLVWGRAIDAAGTRRGFAGAYTLMNLAAMAHALVSSAFGFAAARFALGLGAAANFPGAVRAVAEWHPRRERALAVGLFNAGSNVGAIVAPMLVVPLVAGYGWRWAFLVTGAAGFLGLALWLAFYRRPEEHPRVSPAELAYIQSDPGRPAAKIPWRALLGHRQTWAFVAGKILTDPIWWFYLYWLPKFLKTEHGVDLENLLWPLVTVYTIATVGSIGGGWLSGRLLKAGWSANQGRKAAMLVCALAVTPVVLAPYTPAMWISVLLVSLAAAAHQGWSANLFTTTSDMFPQPVVASVVGIGGFAGALSAMAFQTLTGYYLEWSHSNYGPLLWICGSTYLVALVVLHLLAPRLAPAEVATEAGEGE